VRIHYSTSMRSLLMVLLAVCVWPTAGADQSNADAVIQYVAPQYDGMYPGTEIALSVVIDTTGTVVSSGCSSADPPVPMLITWATEAVEEWRFEESDLNDLREFEIRIRFESAVSTESIGMVQTTLVPPLTMHVVCNVPNIALLERVNGRVPPETCSLHGAPMDVSVVPNRYPCPQFGHATYSRQQFKRLVRFEKAMNRLFPNAPNSAPVDRQAEIKGVLNGDCASFTEVHYCPSCLEARLEWCKKHEKLCSEWSGTY